MQLKKLLILSLICLGIGGGAMAQTCGTTITTFPYIENFDGAAPTGWVSGGTNSSWVLGMPAKTRLKTTASGAKSWVTSLTGSYNVSEQSWVESPCFNFTSIPAPIVEMKLWWSAESSVDGAVLQSSIDGGTTWQRVGNSGDPNNWYIDNSIDAGPGGQAPATAHGWTGGNGTGSPAGWVLAKHALTGLGGQASVKLRIAFASNSNTTVDEGFAFDNFVVYDTPANDAGAVSFTSPGASVSPGVSTPISVTIKNYAATALTSATLGFSVNGVVQPTFAWTGSVAANATSAAIQIGNFTFPAGTHTIKAWTKLPNSAVDGNPTNDTISTSIISCAPLVGSYIINKNAPTSGYIFSTFADATQALANCGVSGPVTITVAPNTGPYNEQVVLPVIPGTSVTNTVTFEGNGNIVTASPVSSNPAIITFNGADYVKINNLILNVDPAATAGWGVKLMNASDNNTISNCTINLPINVSSSFYFGIVAGTSFTAYGNNANNLLVQNNIINGGYHGIIINGTSSGTQTTGNRIIGNQIRDFQNTGILMANGGNQNIIEGNDISRPTKTLLSSFVGINTTGNTNSTQISKNRIHNTHDAMTSTTSILAYGIYTASSPAAGSENIVKNNLIYNFNNASGTAYALYSSGSGNYFFHNTISMDNGIFFTTLRGIFLQGTTISNLKFINNIISLNTTATNKHAIYLSATTIGLQSNNNDLFVGTTGNIGYAGGNMITLADWKAVNSNAYDQASVSVDPAFVSATNLRPQATQLKGAGQPLPAVTDDITGAVRSTTAPDMGAYEFPLPANDAGVTAIVSPVPPVSPGTQQVMVTLKNFGTAALTSAAIGWKVNGISQPDYAWTGNLANQQTESPVTIGSFNFVSGNYTVKVWSKNPNGAADGNASNDTTTLVMATIAPMSGSYTVNKNNPTAGTNFQSISAAATQLNLRGVSAPVTITVAPGTGPYNEQVEILNIPFTSATNTVTFEGSGNTVSTTPGAKPGIIILNGAKYVKVNNFVIELPATATSGWGVQLLNAAENNTISNNTINLSLTSTSDQVNGIVFGNTITSIANNASFTKIQNNVINGGYYGILVNGNAGGLNADDNQITGNQVKDFFQYGIYISNATGTLVESNDLSRPSRTNVANIIYGFYLNGAAKNTKIGKNRFHNTHDAATVKTGTVYGVYTNAAATIGNENLIQNNAIYNIKNAGGSFYAFFNSLANSTHYLFNTISTDPATTYATVRGLQLGSAATNVHFFNNIISLPGSATSKHAIYINNTLGLQFASNRNVLFVGNSGNIGYLLGDVPLLSLWQTVNGGGYDQNSVSADPRFTDPVTGNLKPISSLIDNIAAPITGITDDILNVTRNATTPDPGAYEFAPPASEVGIIAVSGPSSSGCGYSATETITVTIKNFGSAAQTSIPVSYSLNGVAIANQETFTGSLAPNATATYSFTTKADLATAGTFKIVAKTMLTGDAVPVNDKDSLSVVNTIQASIPTLFDFETAATGITRFNTVVRTKSNIVEGTAASNGASSTKGLIMDGVTNPAWQVPVGVTNPWTNNPDNFSGVYLCFSPASMNFTNSMWLNFDLKQLFKLANAQTNFRVTVNGTQVGPTYRPPVSGSPIDWQKISVDLSAYKNAASLQIGLESSVAEEFANGTGTANLIDNISFDAVSKLGVKENLLAAQLHVFPNPSTGNFMVSLPQGKIYQLEVTDLTGKQILSQPAKGDTQLNLEKAAKGIYLLKVSGENGTVMRKLIVE